MTSFSIREKYLHKKNQNFLSDERRDPLVDKGVNLEIENLPGV